MKKMAWLLAALCLVTVQACGDDDTTTGGGSGSGDPIAVDAATEQSALNTADAVANIGSITDDPSGVFGLSGLYATMSPLINAKLAAQAQQSAALRQALTAAPATAYQVADETCITETETSITYDNCDFSGTTIVGSIEVTESETSGTLVADLTIEQAGTYTFNFTIDMGVEETEAGTHVSGDFGIDVSVTAQGASADVAVAMGIDITVATDESVVGYLDISVDATASDGTNGGSYSVAVYAEFTEEGEVIVS